MFDEGYIARKSTHTRGCSVDLTLVDMATHQGGGHGDHL